MSRSTTWDPMKPAPPVRRIERGTKCGEEELVVAVADEGLVSDVMGVV